MKRIRLAKYLASTALAVAVISVASLLFSADAQSDPNAALSQGRTLLKQGHADRALGYLQTALNGFTQTNNARGIAAAEDGLGDLYMIQGQYTVALDHYQKAYQSFSTAAGKDQVNQAGANTAASMAGSTAGAAAQTAGTVAADNGFNANLMLAKIGDTNYRLGRISEAGSAYSMMNVKKPESAAAKTGRHFGGLGAIGGLMSGSKPSVAAPTSAAVGLLEVAKELDEYRIAIVYMNRELGMGRISFANNDLDNARKHFQSAADAGTGGLAVIAKLGQTRRFRAAARTSLGDVALRQGRYKDASDAYNKALAGAKEDKRLDLTWPAQRGLGRSQWLQAAQEKDPKKAASLRESALSNYKDSIGTIETLRAGSLRADESRTTFLATTKDVYDEAVGAFAAAALLNSTEAAVSGKSLDYAAEAFRITEEGRARSLLDMLSEVNAQVTEGIPADLLKRKQDNLDRQQAIAAQLTGIALTQEQKKPSDLEAELDTLQTESDDIENQIRTASPRYAALTAAQSNLVILPVAIAYDFVLEDHILARQGVKKTQRPFTRELAEMVRYAVGYRSRVFVTFGSPVPVTGVDPDSRSDVLAFAKMIRGRVGELYKVLPTAVFAAAMKPSTTRKDLETRIDRLLDALRARRANLGVASGREAIELASEPLETRGIIVHERGRFRVRSRSVLRYYAHTIDHLLETPGRTH